jgi:hypothetical protein
VYPPKLLGEKAGGLLVGKSSTATARDDAVDIRRSGNVQIWLR